jgi:hypothetical protein
MVLCAQADKVPLPVSPWRGRIQLKSELLLVRPCNIDG